MAPSFTLLPPNFHKEPVGLPDLKIACIAFGFTVGFGYLTAVKAAGQTISIYRRTHRITVSYTLMIWMELLVSMVFAIITFLYLDNIIGPGFFLYFGLVTLWSLQVQLLLQIIINRISLLMTTSRTATRLKWGCAGFILLINISVYCIWVPARLEISETYIHINNIWDRIEKSIYLVVDGALNAYFIWLVQSKLVSQGLQKYRPLFKFNIFIVCFSLAMDVMLIGTMSLKNSFIYMQFHPVAYIVKLNIEMTMADLIIKIVRSSARNGGSYTHSYGPGNISVHTHPNAVHGVHMHRRKHSRKTSGVINVQGHRGGTHHHHHHHHHGMSRPLSQNPAPVPTSTPPEYPVGNNEDVKEYPELDKPYGSEFSSRVDIEAVPMNSRTDLAALHPRSGIVKTVATVISSPSAMGSDTTDWFDKDEKAPPLPR